MVKYLKPVISIAAALIINTFTNESFAQTSPYVIEVRVSTATEGTPASVSVELTQNAQIRSTILHFRQFGETEYKQVEMLLSGRVAIATLPGRMITPPYLEYYIEIGLARDSTVYYPEENPSVNPLKLQVKGVDPKDAEVRFLSPEPGETITAEDLVVAISLMFASDAVSKNHTRIYMDGVDVSKTAILSDDVILFNPKNVNQSMDLGTHVFKIVLYDTLGRIYYTKEQSFNLSTSIAIEEAKSALQYNGSGQLEYRNEKIDTTSTTYLRGDLRFNSAYHFLSLGTDIHVTNEDKPDRQPQNRFLATLQAGDYIKLQFGDAYPMFPSLFVSGKRVRGITGSLTFGFFNLDVTWGQTERKIEGDTTGRVYYADSSGASSRQKGSFFIGHGSGDTLIYENYQAGTYTRNFVAVRPSFGSGENFQWGFTVVKAKDDKSSINYGLYPQENFVAGTDLLLAFDNQRIKWTTQVALSLANTDISSGNLSDAAIDSVKGVYDTTKTPSQHQSAINDANDLKNLAKLGRNFITINENLSPLDPVTNLPSTALESELTLNYLNNFIRAFGFRRGVSFVSFGNEFVQTDIIGANLSDRIRLFDNHMLASVSYETKSNNTSHTDKPTTTFNTLTTSLTMYPGVKFPTLTVGYGFNTRKNTVTLDTSSTSIDSTSIADEITNRIFVALNYDFNLYARQSFTATVSIANKIDNTFFLRNQDNVNVSSSLSTNYRIPLQTTISIVVSHNVTYQALQDSTKKYLTVTSSQPFDYQTISLNARYRLMKDRLNLLATIAPSFGNFKRVLVQMGADYQIIENHYITGALDFIKNADKPTDVLASLVYRFSF